jgi:hypothetical protein
VAAGANGRTSGRGMAFIANDGEADTLIPAGIVWMQGESDAALNAEIAERYEANLKRLMDLIRAALRSDDLPVVIGRISDSGRDGRHSLGLRRHRSPCSGRLCGRRWPRGDRHQYRQLRLFRHLALRRGKLH